MHSIKCLLCVIIFTIGQAIAREHSISKHETWFWEPFNPDLSGATSFEPHHSHITATNVYFHTDRFYSLIDNAADQNFRLSKKFAHNAAITPLPLTNVPGFLSNIKSGWISGTTLLIPFPEIDSPHHMGYWMQVLAPVYSYLATTAATDNSNNSSLPSIRTVVIPNLSRGTVMSSSWVMDMIKIATRNSPSTTKIGAAGEEKRQPPPPPPPVRILFWDDLENTPLDSWLGFERIVHVYSRYTRLEKKNATSTEEELEERKILNSGFFSSSEIAEKFRVAVHEAIGIPVPGPNGPIPRTITYLMPTDSSGVTNNKQVLDALQHAAGAVNTKVKLAVRPYSPTPSVPLASLVAVMSRTGLLIGRHAPLLANAAFLPPGAAVLEILPFNWNSGGRSEIYKNLTASRSIVHVAWRAPSGTWMRYESDEDSRYSAWTPVECSSEHCIDAHARAGVEVDVGEFKRILDDVVKVVFDSDDNSWLRKQKLIEKYPWPRRVDLTGTSGLWWDRGGS